MLHTDVSVFPQKSYLKRSEQPSARAPADQIYCSVCDLISENGYHAFSLASAARAADASYQDVASRWKTKRALLQDTFDYVLKISPMFRNDYARLNSMSAREIERACKYALLKWANANRPERMRRVFKRIATSLQEEPELQVFMNEYTDTRCEYVTALFERAIKLGVIKANLEITDLVAVSIGAIHYKICIRGDRPDATYMNSVYDILFAGRIDTLAAANENAA